MTWARQLGSRLRHARRVAGFSQVELAAQLGLSVRTIQAAERGQSTPSSRTIDRWLERCDLTLTVELAPRNAA